MRYNSFKYNSETIEFRVDNSSSRFVNAMPHGNEPVDVLSSESSDSDKDVELLCVGNRRAGEVVDQPTQEGIGQLLKEVTPEEAMIKRAEMYQEYMKRIPIPTHRGSVVPFSSWTGLGRSIKQLYGQPLHYLTNAQLNEWDRQRIGSEDEDTLLDSIIHPCKAEATIWLLEEVHRRMASHHHVAKLWLSDPMHHSFVDNIFPQLGKA